MSQNSDPKTSILQKAGQTRLNASAGHAIKFPGKEVLTTHKDGEFVLRIPRTHSETGTHRKERENLSGESQGDRGEFQSEETKDDAETQNDFWSIQGDFIYRHHVEPRVQFFVPKEESFPIPLKYIDVIRSTHTDLDVAQEKRVDYHWNVHGNRNLSDSWTGFTRSTLLNETPPKGYMWSRERLTKFQTTSLPDHMEPDAWTRIGKAAQRRKKQEWAIEKPKLEHARDLRGIYSIDPSDEEYKDITKNARRKLKTSKAAAMPCKKGRFLKHAHGKPLFQKQKKPRHLEAHESTRQRVESVTKRMHEEHVAGKGHDSVLHYNLVHKFIPMPQAMKIPDAKAAVDKELKKA